METDLVVGAETELGVGGVETELAVLGGGVCGVGTELAVHVELGGDGASGLACAAVHTGPVLLREEVQSWVHFFLTFMAELSSCREDAGLVDCATPGTLSCSGTEQLCPQLLAFCCSCSCASDVSNHVPRKYSKNVFR